MNWVTTLGILAGTLTTAAYLPQVFKTWQSKSAADISWMMLITLCIGITLWLVYGVYVHDLPVILANCLTLMLTSAILILKIRYHGVPSLSSAQSTRQL